MREMTGLYIAHKQPFMTFETLSLTKIWTIFSIKKGNNGQLHSLANSGLLLKNVPIWLITNWEYNRILKC